jgi:CHAD domain-containing protein
MAKPRKIIGLNPNQSYRENARIVLPQKVEEVYSWEQFIRDPERREELHNMRISIKRLRYTMEFFSVAYQLAEKHSKKASVTDDKHFAEFLEVIVDWQEILGDIHDSDVVLEVLDDYASQSGNHGELGAALPGVAKLIARTKETRKADYETFLEKCKQLSATGFKERLLSFLTS